MKWRTQDNNLLIEKVKAFTPREELLKIFHPHSWKAIEAKAYTLGFKKLETYLQNKNSSLKIEEVNELKKMTEKDRKKFMKDVVEKTTKKVVNRLPERQRLEPKKITRKKKLKSESWLLQFSDLHWGSRFEGVETGGLSEYNTTIAKARVDNLATTTARILDYSVQQPNELVITFLGDMIENTLMRGQQLGQVELDLVDQVITVTELTLDYIIFLSKYFKRIRCYGIYGNHGRMTKGKTDALPQENFDRLVYHALQYRTKDMPGITFQYATAQHMIIDVKGWNFWIEHGDSVRSWAGIPFYGAKREMANIQFMLALMRSRVDYVLMGHHHTPAEFERIIINGSFMGGDTYSIGNLRRMSLPYQNLLGITKNHGLVWKRPLCLEKEPTSFKPKIYR